MIQRFTRIPGPDARFITMETIVEMFAERLFPGFELLEIGQCRVLRDCDIEVEEEAEDLVRLYESALKRRRRGSVIRLTINKDMSRDLQAFITEQMGVSRGNVFKLGGLMGLAETSQLIPDDRPEMSFEPYVARMPERIADFGGDHFEAIRAKDMLVHHPFESFDVVVQFLRQAARDPNVVAIKQTLYRTSEDSPILEALMEAAEAGKHLFIEKPLAFDLDGCAQIEAAIQQAGVFAQVGHCIRFWPEYMALQSTIESGELGALKSLSLTRRSARPGGGNPQHWVNNEKLSGGAAFDMHVHDTDFVLHLFGAPKSVHSSTSQGMSGPDHIFTHYMYDGIAVQAEGGWDYPQHYGFCMAFEAVFENGALAYNSSAETPLTLTRKDKETEVVSVKQPGPKESGSSSGNISSLGGYFNELEYFTNCLKANKAPQIATIAQSSDTIRVLCAELESAKSGNSTIL